MFHLSTLSVEYKTKQNMCNRKSSLHYRNSFDWTEVPNRTLLTQVLSQNPCPFSVRIHSPPPPTPPHLSFGKILHQVTFWIFTGLFVSECIIYRTRRKILSSKSLGQSFVHQLKHIGSFPKQIEKISSFFTPSLREKEEQY